MLPEGYFADPLDQLKIALKRISHLLAINDQNQEDTALLIQPMVYGNYGKDSLDGQFYTRNIVTGDKEIQGEYFQDKFNAIGASGSDISKIAKTTTRSSRRSRARSRTTSRRSAPSVSRWRTRGSG